MSGRRSGLIPTKRPTSRERVAYFVSAGLLGAIVGILARIVGWGRDDLLIAAMAAVALFGMIATPLLLGRRAT